MAKAIDLLLEIAPVRKIFNPTIQKSHYFRLAFFTLTLSAPQDPYTDSDIKKNLLERFIRVYRNKGMRNYIWRAERQKNGNIHFHFITDTFIEKTQLRDSWNNIQNRLEFIDYFEKKFGHRNPNSTDIKSVKGVNEVRSYILKYMTKPEQKDKQQVLDFQALAKQKGKVWDCSANLKLNNDTADFLSSDLWAKLQELKEKGLIEQLDGEYYKLFFFNKNSRSRLFPPHFFQAYNDYLDRVRNFQDTGT